MRFIIIILFTMAILLLADSSFAQRLDSIDSLQKMVDEIVRELSNALKMNKQLMEERVTLKKEIEELTGNNQTLQDKLNEIKKKEIGFSILEKRLEEYAAKITQDENKIQELTQTNQALEEKLLEINKDFQEKIDLYKVENNQLKESLKEHGVRLTQSEAKIEELEQLKASLEATHSQLQDTLKGYQTKIAQTNAKINELEQLKDSSIEELEQRLQANQQEQKNLKASLEKDLQELKNNLATKNEESKNYKTNLARAEDNIEKLIEQMNAQKKEVFRAFYEAGKAYAQAKRYKEAVVNFEECLKINPNSADLQYNLGVLYQYEYGDRVAATRHLKKYLELNPQAKDRKEIEFLLGMLEK